MIHVVAAVLKDDAGRVLVSQRPPAKSLSGAWEFPGGKMQPDESREDALARELEEELGVQVEAARPLIRYRCRYPDLEVDLDAWHVSRWAGKPEGLEGQAIDWRESKHLLASGLLPADAAIVDAIGLPSLVAVTPPMAIHGEAALLDRVEIAAEALTSFSLQAAPGGLIVLRLPGLAAEELLKLAAGAACRLEGTPVRLMLHGGAELVDSLQGVPANLQSRLMEVVAGLHIPARFLKRFRFWQVPGEFLLGASCHDEFELRQAAMLDADYAFLGPLKPTSSHPGQPGLGWEKFALLIKHLPLPVYAIGGVGPDDLETAWAAGAQGVAGISAFWPK